MQKRTSLPVWFVRLACVMSATLALLVIAPPVAALAAVKDPTITLQFDNFVTSEGIDVTKKVVTIDTSAGDTSIKLTVDDAYSNLAPRDVRRALTQVDSSGNSKDIDYANGNVFNIKAKQLTEGTTLYVRTLSPYSFKDDGTRVRERGNYERSNVRLNISLVDGSKAVGESNWNLGDGGFNYRINSDTFKFLNGTTISLTPIRLPLSYKHNSDGTTTVGLGCSPDDVDFYKAVKNRNVWQKYTDADIAQKTKAIDQGWAGQKLGTWGDKGVDWMVFGYAEFNTLKPNEPWSVTLCAKIGFAGEGHAQYLIFTGDLNFGLGGDMMAALKRYPEEGRFTGNLSIGAYGELELYVGIGCQYIASVGAYGNGMIHAGLDLLPKQDFGFNDVYVRGELGAKAKVFGFTVATWKILERQLDLYKRQRPSELNPQSEDPLSAAGGGFGGDLASVSADVVYPQVPRDYLDAGPSWEGEGDLVAMADDETGAARLVPIATNIYSETDVHTASVGDEAIMTYIADANTVEGVESRSSAANRGVLVYARYDALTDAWSVPMPVVASSPAGEGASGAEPQGSPAGLEQAAEQVVPAPSDEVAVSEEASAADEGAAALEPAAEAAADGALVAMDAEDAGLAAMDEADAAEAAVVDGEPAAGEAEVAAATGEGAALEAAAAEPSAPADAAALAAPATADAAFPAERTADYNPSVCMAADGTAYVAWLDARTEISDGMTLGEVARSVVVRVARIAPDGTIKIATVDSDAQASDGAVPSAPQVALVGGRPCVAWLTNQIDSGSSIIGLSGSHDLVCTWLDAGLEMDAPGAWKTATVNGAATGALTSLTLGDLGGEPVCGWSVEKAGADSDVEGGVDLADSSSVYQARPFSSATPTLVASGASNALFAKCQGEDMLTYYQNESIMGIDASGNVQTMYVHSDKSSFSSSEYRIAGDLAKNAIVSYAVSGDGTTDLQARMLTNGTWSDSFAVTNQDRVITHYAVTMVDVPNEGSLPLFVFSSEDASKVSVNSDGDGSANLYSVLSGDLKTLSIEDIQFDDSMHKPTESMPLKLLVKNVGTSGINGVTVSVSFKRSDGGVSTFDGRIDQPLAVNESVWVPIEIQLPDQASFVSYDGVSMTAKALPADVRERDLPRQDDTQTKTFNVGDSGLVVDADHLLVDGQETVVGIVVNDGLAAQGGTLLFENAETGELLTSVPVPVLGAHESFEYAYDAPAGQFVQGGTDFVRVRLEYDGVQDGSISSQTTVAALPAPAAPAPTDGGGTPDGGTGGGSKGKPSTTASKLPRTGDVSPMPIVIVLVAGSVFVAAGCYGRRKADGRD